MIKNDFICGTAVSEPENYSKAIKAFLMSNPSSTAEQICNGIGGRQELCISELKRLISSGEVEYSLMDYTYCV